MPSGTKWPYVNKSAPCAVCKRPDWCQRSPDGAVAKCRRVTSPKPNKDNSAWYHHVGAAGYVAPTPPASPTKPPPTRRDFELLARQSEKGLSPARLERIARELGISPASLRRLQIGWDAFRGVYTFPMREPEELHVTGIRTRYPDGRKRAIYGGSGGLFIPRELEPGVRAYLVEGPTDTGAALDLGLNAFGRENCSAGADYIVAALKRWRFPELIIFSQRDEAHYTSQGRVYYPAQDGAERIAGRARLYCPDVRVIMPPPNVGKDVRDWTRKGATAADVERAAAEAPRRKLAVVAR
jgi:hypothetical protein